jgi:arginase family enzyme
MIYEFLTPVDKESLLNGTELHPAQIGNYMFIYDGKEVDLSDFNIAILGVDEDRGSKLNGGSSRAADFVREEFYKLFLPPAEREFKVIDLGNIKRGETVRDTYFAVASVITELIVHKVIPVIIGGSHDLTYGQYLGYKSLQTLINLVMVDERLDMLENPEKEMDSDSFVMNILTQTPNYLFNYSHLGYQTYLNDYKLVQTLESLNFDCHRLGLIRQNMEEVEPVLRDADMLSIDISAIRQADAPAHAHASPNGFTGEELCQITRYAGLSDKLTTLGIYEMNPGFDNNRQTAQLVAQMIWYFIEGYYSRVGDYPVTIDEHLKFTVHVKEADHDLIFWRSRKTDRWWMELPYGDKQKFARHQLVPCSFRDYETACRHELPDRWMKAYTKLV